MATGSGLTSICGRSCGSDPTTTHSPGFDSPGRSYFAYASFSDPDGNGWLLQEVTTRIPGRGWED